MLVVVHYGDVKFLFESAFYLETFGGFDVLKVYSAESGSYSLDGFNEFLGVFFVYFNVESIYAAVDFEKQSFAFHYRFAGYGSYIAETENGCAVGYDGYKVTFVCIFICIVGFFLDFQAWFCHAGGVCQRQIVLCAVGLGGNNFNFPRFALGMVFQCCFFSNLDHCLLLFLLFFCMIHYKITAF